MADIPKQRVATDLKLSTRHTYSNPEKNASALLTPHIDPIAALSVHSWLTLSHQHIPRSGKAPRIPAALISLWWVNHSQGFCLCQKKNLRRTSWTRWYSGHKVEESASALPCSQLILKSVQAKQPRGSAGQSMRKRLKTVTTWLESSSDLTALKENKAWTSTETTTHTPDTEALRHLNFISFCFQLKPWMVLYLGLHCFPLEN